MKQQRTVAIRASGSFRDFRTVTQQLLLLLLPGGGAVVSRKQSNWKKFGYVGHDWRLQESSKNMHNPIYVTTRMGALLGLSIAVKAYTISQQLTTDDQLTTLTAIALTLLRRCGDGVGGDVDDS
ncbi:unnamed protein product [Ceratitis capitata]|uniref:(Mediterranean fruit fly) hypothetical protein n=1 Tax=Ceratitis capitata TaxID=7213 RepID=A0A811V3D3_CERCA|nr:unnamed protein product [Ceratitis capitata]